MNPKHLLLCLAGGLVLASCSSEPSDWRPDKKVSVDMVAPGTRSSQNFDVAEEHAAAEAHGNGGVVAHPISSHVTELDEHAKPTPAQSTTAKGQKMVGTQNIEDEPDAALTQDGAKE